MNIAWARPGFIGIRGPFMYTVMAKETILVAKCLFYNADDIKSFIRIEQHDAIEN